MQSTNNFQSNNFQLNNFQSNNCRLSNPQTGKRKQKFGSQPDCIERRRFKNNMFAAATAVFLICVFSSTACNWAGLGGGLSNSAAIDAIKKTDSYRRAASYNIDTGMMSNAQCKIYRLSEDETAEAAAPRARADFFKRHPQMWAAVEAGYAELTPVEPSLEPHTIFSYGEIPEDIYRMKLGRWNFKRCSATITDKGRALWSGAGLPVNETALLLATNGEPEITGITDDTANIKRVEFEVPWKPTALGNTLQHGTAEFAALPEEIRQALQSKKPITLPGFGAGGGNLVLDFSTKRKGFIRFKKYEDGWRTMDVNF